MPAFLALSPLAGTLLIAATAFAIGLFVSLYYMRKRPK